MTYKENVSDVRMKPAVTILREPKEYGVDTFGYDPLMDIIEDDLILKG